MSTTTVCYTVPIVNDTRETTDEKLGANLRILRERKSIPQAAVARQMSGRGHPWHQATVSRVETGKQPVTFAEAADLAEVLETTLDRLTWAGAEARAVEYLNAAGYSVLEGYEAVAEGVRFLLGAVDAVREDAARNERAVSARVQEARLDALGRAEEYGDPAGAVAEGFRRHDERGGSAGE